MGQGKEEAVRFLWSSGSSYVRVRVTVKVTIMWRKVRFGDTGFVGGGRIMLRDAWYVLPDIFNANAGSAAFLEVCVLLSAILLLIYLFIHSYIHFICSNKIHITVNKIPECKIRAGQRCLRDTINCP